MQTIWFSIKLIGELKSLLLISNASLDQSVCLPRQTFKLLYMHVIDREKTIEVPPIPLIQKSFNKKSHFISNL